MAVGMAPSSLASFFDFTDPLYIVERHWCPGILGERFSKGGGFREVRRVFRRPGALVRVGCADRGLGATA